MRHIVPALALSLALGCGGPSPPDVSVERPSSQPIAGLSDDETAALNAAALRDLLKDSKDGDSTYIWIGGQNPSADLLRRLQVRWSKLQSASEMPADGYRVNFTEIRRPGPGRADVRAESYYRGPGNWMVFHLAEKGSEWQVVEVSGEAVH